MSDLIIKGPDGTPTFIGREDPNNPPPQKIREGSKLECPICHNMFDYLVGEDTRDGGRLGCEADWKPAAQPERRIDDRQEDLLS